MSNGKYNDFSGKDSIISSEVSASETVKWRSKTGQFLNTGFAYREGG